MILIVEDEALFSQAIAEMLDGFGKRVIIATDGDQALEKMEKYHYSLAVIDLVLPGPMNGLEVIKKIKLHTPSTRVIAISGYGNQSLIQKTYKAGADVFIAKPFKPVELIDHVEKLLFKRKAVETEEPLPDMEKPTTPTSVAPEPVAMPVMSPQPQPVVNQPEPARATGNTIPELFRNFPQKSLVELVKLGKVTKINQGQRLKINYTENIVIIAGGMVGCSRDNVHVGMLNVRESIGQESLTQDIDPNAWVIIETTVPSKLFIIPKVQLLRYLSNHSELLLETFKANLKDSLKHNIILKTARHMDSPEEPGLSENSSENRNPQDDLII